MEIMYDKPFKTYEEQLDLLRTNYGFPCKNSPETIIDFLKVFPYYDLINGYKDCFLENENFNKDIHLGHLMVMLILDRKFQSILLNYSSVVENAFKSKLAYVIAKNIGVSEKEYLNPSHYYKSNSKGRINLAPILESCNSLLDGDRRTPQPTKHYMDKHNHVPPWILFKNISFSNVINLFQLLKDEEKSEVVDLLLPPSNLSYPKKVEFVITSLNIIRNFRNKIAHNLKFITYKYTPRKLDPASILALAPKKLLTWKDIRKNNRGLNDIYADILAISVFITSPIVKHYFLTEIGLFLSYSIAEECLKDADEDEFLQLIRECRKKYIGIINLPEDVVKRIDVCFEASVIYENEKN